MSTILARYGIDLNWLVISLILLVLVTTVNVLGFDPRSHWSFHSRGRNRDRDAHEHHRQSRGVALPATLRPIRVPSGGFGAIGGGWCSASSRSLALKRWPPLATRLSTAAATSTALFAAVIIGGVFLTFGAYAAMVGFGVNHMTQLVGNAAPLLTGGAIRNGALRIAIDTAGVTRFTASDSSQPLPSPHLLRDGPRPTSAICFRQDLPPFPHPMVLDPFREWVRTGPLCRPGALGRPNEHLCLFGDGADLRYGSCVRLYASRNDRGLQNQSQATLQPGLARRPFRYLALLSWSTHCGP